MQNENLSVGTKIEFRYKTCNCVGGQFVQATGTIVKRLVAANGTWYVVNDTVGRTITTHSDNVIKEIQ